jgi:hypothetical protein
MSRIEGEKARAVSLAVEVEKWDETKQNRLNLASNSTLGTRVRRGTGVYAGHNLAFYSGSLYVVAGVGLGWGKQLPVGIAVQRIQWIFPKPTLSGDPRPRNVERSRPRQALGR